MVVGLGNPGEEYEGSRHNVGFQAMGVWADRVGATFGHRRYRSLFTRVVRHGEDILLVKPLTFMNDSGSAVSRWQQAVGLKPNRIIVIHDDLDLPISQLRIKTRGGHGGHKGVRSIQEALGGGDFLRVKVGLGLPGPRRDPIELVVGPSEMAESRELEKALEQAADA